jgi:2-polyprenyl-3-methyl-5-hydroxy-6-metoxy-1,4-benzoquinol methylase
MTTETKELDYLSDRNLIPCVCGDDRGIVIRRKDRYQLKVKFRFCTKCGHVRASNPLSVQAAERFYGTSDYRSMYHGGASADEVVTRMTPKPRTLSPLLQYVRRLGIESGQIMEWGCGGGWNLVPFRDAGWTVVGFDYDKPYISRGREVLGLPLFEIQQESLDPESIKTDVVLLNHVLEHAVDPVKLLVRLRKFCTPSTTLVVGVPLLETISVWHWRDFFHIAHIHYFSNNSLVKVARYAGFNIVDSDIRLGLFAMRLADTQEVKRLKHRSVLPSGSAITSMWYLLVGFIDLRYRSRQTILFVLKSLRLLQFVRRAKHKLIG